MKVTEVTEVKVTEEAILNLWENLAWLGGSDPLARYRLALERIRREEEE